MGSFLLIATGIPEIEWKLFLILNKSILIFANIAIKICLQIKIAIDLHSEIIDMEHLKIVQIYQCAD